jgi:Flp pilus assembly protein TadD
MSSLTSASRLGLLWGLLLLFASGCTTFEGARLYSRGTAALEAGRTESAVADLERAAELVPEASEVQNHLGIAYQAAGRDAEAVRAFERAVALDCDNAAAQINLERIRLRIAQGAP